MVWIVWWATRCTVRGTEFECKAPGDEGSWSRLGRNNSYHPLAFFDAKNITNVTLLDPSYNVSVRVGPLSSAGTKGLLTTTLLVPPGKAGSFRCNISGHLELHHEPGNVTLFAMVIPGGLMVTCGPQWNPPPLPATWLFFLNSSLVAIIKNTTTGLRTTYFNTSYNEQEQVEVRGMTGYFNPPPPFCVHCVFSSGETYGSGSKCLDNDPNPPDPWSDRPRFYQSFIRDPDVLSASPTLSVPVSEAGFGLIAGAVVFIAVVVIAVIVISALGRRRPSRVYLPTSSGASTRTTRVTYML